jgi:putative oxidoreductase
MLGHGLQKLNGAFEGPGLEGTEKVMENLGLHPPKVHARAVALSETLGGGLTAAGFLSPLGPAMVIGTQAVAISKVHLKNGFWNHKGGFEFNTLLVASAFAIAAQGPGPFSLDGILRKQRSGLHWGLAAAALGVGAAMGVMKAAESMAPASTGADDEGDATLNGRDGARDGAVDLGSAGEPVLLDDQA